MRFSNVVFVLIFMATHCYNTITCIVGVTTQGSAVTLNEGFVDMGPKRTRTVFFVLLWDKRDELRNRQAGRKQAPRILYVYARQLHVTHCTVNVPSRKRHLVLNTSIRNVTICRGHHSRLKMTHRHRATWWNCIHAG